MLRTPLVGEDCGTAQAVRPWYRARWAIALACRLLTQGGRMADRRGETAERLEKCLAVSRIVAWRMHPITQAARQHSEVGCPESVSEQAWPTISLLQTPPRPPKHPPPLRVIPRMLAQLGGGLARNGDGEPGAETLWRGSMDRQRALHALEIAKAVHV
jgi:hypothetical protein